MPVPSGERLDEAPGLLKAETDHQTSGASEGKS